MTRSPGNSDSWGSPQEDAFIEHRARWLLAAGVLVAIGGPPAEAIPRVSQHQLVVLEVRLLTAEPVAGTKLPLLLHVDPERGGQLQLDVHWPDRGATVGLKLRAKERPTDNAVEHVIDLQANVLLSGGREVHASRTIRVAEGTTVLFEVFSQGERALTLALQAEIATQTVVLTAPTAGRRVVSAAD